MSILNKFSLSGKKALVYCPEFVYGEAVAEGLLEAGAQVWLCGEDTAALGSIAEKLAARGKNVSGTVEYHQGSEAAAAELADYIQNTMGGIDVYVDNGSHRHLTGWAHSYKDILDSFRVSQLGLILTVQKVGAIMAEQGRGSVIFLSDYAALVGCDVQNYVDCPEEFEKDFSADYGYIKGSYVNYSRQAAGFLGEHNCRCNTIAFGPMQNTKPKAFEDAFIRHSHISRLVNEEDVKGIAVFLASDASEFITGTTIPVDGGYVAK